MEERESAHHPERESARATIDEWSTDRQETCRNGAMKLKTPVDDVAGGTLPAIRRRRHRDGTAP